jgi:hypothetical protein
LLSSHLVNTHIFSYIETKKKLIQF